MKIIQVLTLILVLASLGLNAQWGKKIRGNGDYTTTTRSLGSYEGIEMSGWFDVEIIRGSEGTITLEGERNLLEHLVTEVKGGTLKIRTEKGYQLQPSDYNRGIVITIPVDEISFVTLSGSGDIVCKDGLKSNQFTTTLSGSGDIHLEIEAARVVATLSGSGDITLSGTADNLEATVSGSGDIKAYELQAANARAVIAGSADIRLTVTESLHARVSGSGDIRYRGNPARVDSKVAGSGDVEAE